MSQTESMSLETEYQMESLALGASVPGGLTVHATATPATIDAICKRRESLYRHFCNVKRLDTQEGMAEFIENLCSALAESLQTLANKSEEAHNESLRTLKDVAMEVKSQGIHQGWLRTKLDIHEGLITNLYLDSRLLEGIALEYRPYVDALVLRRRLDDARFSVAAAFMHIYPGFFPGGNLTNNADPTGKSVMWRAFKKMLATLYYDFHEPRQFADGRFYLFQVCSRFSVDKLVADGSDNQLIGTFSASKGVACDRDGWTEELPDKELERQIRFFLPVFIWEFNCAKKDIDTTEHRMKEVKDTLLGQEEDYRRLFGRPAPGAPSTAPPPPEESQAESRFAVGTAFFIRMKAEWRKFIDEQNKAPSAPAEPALDTGSDHPWRQKQLGSYFKPYVPLAKNPHSALPYAYPPGWEWKGYAGSIGPLAEGEVGNVPLSGLATSASASGRLTSSTTLRSASEVPPTSSGRLPFQFAEAALQTAIDNTKGDIASLEDRRKEHMEVFEVLRKCLAVLLDDEVLHLAVLQETALRLATNDFAHMNDDRAVGFSDAYQRVNTILEDAHRLEESEVDFQRACDKLGTILTTEDYYASKNESLENSIDDFIKKAVAATDRPATGPVTDMHFLLCKLDPLFPEEK